MQTARASVMHRVENYISCNLFGTGSCWAFASTETLESTWALKTGILQELSEQFVLDCTPNPHSCGGTGGCGGGTAALVYNQLQKYGGIPSEWTYPYISGSAGAAGKCHGLPLKPLTPHSGEPMQSANVTGHVSLKTNSYKAMLDAVSKVGPLTITVDAGARGEGRWGEWDEG